jgi:2-polyprenyl-6-methoxyphenol hydroxylase-like FAD-dependent oxidoreductase
VLWMRVSRKPSDNAQTGGRIQPGAFFVMIDRGDYWQCAYVIEKAGLDRLRQRGLPALREALVALAPFLRDRVDLLTRWDDIKLLTVVVDRLARWWAPGVLCIGDAAHAMSPIGGVGINLAIQDAIATANRLAPALRAHRVTTDDLAAVQARRAPPAHRIQSLQVAIQNRVIAEALAGRTGAALRIARLALRHLPPLRRTMARVLAVGQRERLTAGPP